MRYVCGAVSKSTGLPCNRAVEARGERCHYHGALSTGPRTAIGKARNGLTLKLYRIQPSGYKQTGKAQRRREARARRLEALRKHEPIRRKKAWRWKMRQLIASGLPLITLASSDD